MTINHTIFIKAVSENDIAPANMDHRCFIALPL